MNNKPSYVAPPTLSTEADLIDPKYQYYQENMTEAEFWHGVSNVLRNAIEHLSEGIESPIEVIAAADNAIAHLNAFASALQTFDPDDAVENVNEIIASTGYKRFAIEVEMQYKAQRQEQRERAASMLKSASILKPPSHQGDLN